MVGLGTLKLIKVKKEVWSFVTGSKESCLSATQVPWVSVTTQ